MRAGVVFLLRLVRALNQAKSATSFNFNVAAKVGCDNILPQS